MCGRILCRFRLQKLVGVFMKRVEDRSGRNNGILDDGQLGERDCMPFGLWGK